MNYNNLFRNLPILYFVVALLVVINNIAKFAPAQVLSFPLAIIVPGLLILFGFLGLKRKKNNQSQK